MNKIEAWIILIVLIAFVAYMFQHDNKVKASKEYKSNIAKGKKPRKYLYTHKWWAWLVLVICFLTVGSQIVDTGSDNSSHNSSAPKTQRVSKKKKAKAKLPIKEIDFEGEYENDDDVTYKPIKIDTFKAHGEDSWSTAPAIVDKVQVAYLRKAKRFKPKYLADNLPTDNKNVDRFLLIYLKIPKAYSADVNVALDGGVVDLPTKNNPKYGNEVALLGQVVEGQKGDSLINDSTGDKAVQVPCARDYRQVTKKGELNITNNMLVIPLSTNMHGLHPLTIKFGANVNGEDHHTYNVKADW